MIYVLIYLSVGFFLVVFKTPIRKLVDDEISKIKIQYAVRGDDPPSLKLTLFRITLSTVLIIIYPIMLFVAAKEKVEKQSKKDSVIQKPNFAAEPSLLNQKVTVEEAEEANMVDVNGQKVAFGYSHNQWVSLCEKMKKGDELYVFRTSEESWDNLAGREGIALVRNGEIVGEIITVMS